MKQPQFHQSTPPIQRLLVTFGGAAIFFESLVYWVTNSLNVDAPPILVAGVAFVAGAGLAWWVLRRSNTNSAGDRDPAR